MPRPRRHHPRDRAGDAVGAAVRPRTWRRPRPERRQALPRAQVPDGSDFMVDVIKTLDIEYLPSNPASSFRGLHESLINYGSNKKPEFLTCTHEESAVAMATAISRSPASRC